MPKNESGDSEMYSAGARWTLRASGRISHYSMRSEWSTEHQADGFAMAMGGGVDFVVNRGLAWRVGNVEYTHTWIPDVNQIHASDGVRFTSELTLRMARGNQSRRAGSLLLLTGTSRLLVSANGRVAANQFSSQICSQLSSLFHRFQKLDRQYSIDRNGCKPLA
jgi:hypothetical protein